MKNQIAVIGLGRFGSTVALALAENKYNVMAIDRDESKVKLVADNINLAMVLDATDERALKDAGMQNADIAIVSIGENIEASILVVMLLKELGIKHIIAKAVTELHGRVLNQIGVDRVVHPERDMAYRLANTIIKPEFLDHIELSKNFSIAEFPAPSSLWNKTLKESNLRADYGINIIAIQKKKTVGEEWNVNPSPSDRISEGDVLVVLGSNEQIEKLHKLSASV